RCAGERTAGGDGMSVEPGGEVGGEVSKMAAEAPTNGAATNGHEHVGRSLRRKEDRRLITGRARYVDDISLPGTLWAAFVRSPETHAKVVSIDVSAARARPGVH